jgi:hypothetical protein
MEIHYGIVNPNENKSEAFGPIRANKLLYLEISREISSQAIQDSTPTLIPTNGKANSSQMLSRCHPDATQPKPNGGSPPTPDSHERRAKPRLILFYENFTRYSKYLALFIVI